MSHHLLSVVKEKIAKSDSIGNGGNTVFFSEPAGKSKEKEGLRQLSMEGTVIKANPSMAGILG